MLGGAIGKSVKKLSKGRKIVKKSEKPQRPEKLQRSSVWRNVYRSTGPPSTKNSSFRYSSDSFSSSFLLGPEVLSILCPERLLSKQS